MAEIIEKVLARTPETIDFLLDRTVAQFSEFIFDICLRQQVRFSEP